jgi:hypothetical protein
VEATLTGWTGLFNSSSASSRVSGGFDGSWSLRSTNNTTGTAACGFVDKPHWLDGSAGRATVAGASYAGSVWVKPDIAGQKVSLFLRELSPSGATVGSKTVTLTTRSTAWAQVTNAYTAAGSGDALAVYVSTPSAPAKGGFNADAMSLTSSSS